MLEAKGEKIQTPKYNFMASFPPKKVKLCGLFVIGRY